MWRSPQFSCAGAKEESQKHPIEEELEEEAEEEKVEKELQQELQQPKIQLEENKKR